MPMRSHSRVGTWFMCDADMNTANGARAKSPVASSAVPARGSTRRTRAPNSPTLRAPKTGFTSHSPRTRLPSASIAGPPIGNCP